MSNPSEATLRKAWREAVFAVYGDACIICGGSPCSPHHVVKRRNGILKWDVQNGRPLCAYHHNEVEDNKLKIPLTDHLRDLQHFDIKTWLTRTGQTEEGFLKDELAALYTAVMNPEPYRSDE
jgi:hypothetical protein